MNKSNILNFDNYSRKLNYTGIMTTGFKDFLLRPELQRSIVDCGFEHPSEGILS